MRIYSIVLGLSFWMLLIGCGNADQINARSLKTAHQSVGMIKQRLAVKPRIEFEVAYWLLRGRIKDDTQFLTAIDKKFAAELVEMAKAEFVKDKAEGLEDYAGFDNWEQMIDRQVQLRGEQDRAAVDPRDKKGYPRVDYKMHAM